MLCPPARVGQFAVSALGVHVLSLNDDGAMVGFWLLGQRKGGGRQAFVCIRAVLCTGTVNGHICGAEVTDNDGVSLFVCIIVGGSGG